MIAVDTSAIMAILLDEDDADRFTSALANADTKVMSAMSYLEASIVLIGRQRAHGLADLDALLDCSGIEIVALDREQVMTARAAFERYGKGLSRAGLNHGDCAAYALAVSRGLPLLFKGGDFALTDVTPAR